MMKATGIIRRVDKLGRIVLPKETRRVQRIRTGDPLEMFVGDEGEIIFKKYNPDDLIYIAGGIARSYHKRTRYPVLICNLDHVVGMEGGNVKPKKVRNAILAVEYSEHLESIRLRDMTTLRPCILQPIQGMPDIKAFLTCPIINDARDIYGSFSLLCDGDMAPEISQPDIERFIMAAAFVGDQFDESE